MSDVKVIVVTSTGRVLVQVVRPDGTFYLTDGDQTWESGFGIATEWTVLPSDDPRYEDAVEEYGWILSD